MSAKKYAPPALPHKRAHFRVLVWRTGGACFGCPCLRLFAHQKHVHTMLDCLQLYPEDNGALALQHSNVHS